jgi:hypothetical protein
MNAPARPRLLLISAMTVIACLYALFLVSNIYLLLAMHAVPLHATATPQQLPQADFARFWYVGKMFLVQRAAQFGVHLALPPWWHQVFTIDILSLGKDHSQVWLYPPTMGILAMAFGLLPLALSFWLWRVACLGVAAFVLRYAGLDWSIIVLGLASPAEIHDIIAGQTGALTGALLAAGLLCLDRKPRSGGVLTGLLCIKPQAALFLPLILLRRRYWPALLAFIITVTAAVAVSVLLEGVHSWVWFLTVAEPQSALVMNAPDGHLPPDGITVLVMARTLHAGVGLAWLVQAVVSLLAALLLWDAWRRPAEPLRRLALSLCLAVLMSPYGFLYDLVGFSIAMTIMMVHAPDRQKPLFGVLWLLGGYGGTLLNLTGVAWVPVGVMLAVALSWHRPAVS